jgi:hypothetical protein
MLRRSQALSLSLLLLAGCAAPTGAPTTATAPADPGPVVVSQLGEGPTQAATAPAAPAAPAALSVPVTTLDGSVSYRGEALAGYTLQVRDAQSDALVAVLADLSAAQGLAVSAGSLVTDAQGRFSLQVANLTAGTALRVTATKDHVTLETVLIGTPAKAGYSVQAAGDGMSITELSTAVARIARGLVRTTQVLTPQAAQPVLERLNARLLALMPKLEAELARMPEMAQQMVNPPKDGEPLDAVVANAGLRQSLTQAAAELVAEVAKQAQTDGNRAAAAADPAVQAQLAKIVLAGTMLNAAFDPTKGTLGLVNRFTGYSADAASGDLERVTRPPSSGSGKHAAPVEGPVDEEPTDEEPGRVFQRVTATQLDAKWTIVNIRLEEGMKPSDFTRMVAEFYDDNDVLLTTAQADPADFPNQDRVDNDPDLNYHVPIAIKRRWGQSVYGEEFAFTEGNQSTKKSRLWRYDMPDWVDHVEFTLKEKGNPEPHGPYTISDEKVRKLFPDGSGKLRLPLKGFALGELADITVKMYDRYDRVVCKVTSVRQAPMFQNRPEDTEVVIDIDPYESRKNWEVGKFFGFPSRVKLKFTDKDGQVHRRSKAIIQANVGSEQD